jgi:hypothetical protein
MSGAIAFGLIDSDSSGCGCADFGFNELTVSPDDYA